MSASSAAHQTAQASATPSVVPVRPAEKLTGRTLGSGWHVVERVHRTPQQTGARFSVGYIVEREGHRAFLKALDYQAAIAHGDPARALADVTMAYLHERDLLRECKTYGLSRVATAIDEGIVYADPADANSVVQYLVFELADGDLRKTLDFSDKFDAGLRLRILHHVTVALHQLHQHKIAHQDVKPSNVLSFSHENKIADLGRASKQGVTAPHDNATCAGDPSYAPPEGYFGFEHPDWRFRRLGCDLYHLGSLIASLFVGVSAHMLMQRQVAAVVDVKLVARMSYDDALPFLQSAFIRVIDEDLAPSFPEFCRTELCEAFRQLCEPDMRRRGDPKQRIVSGAEHDLQRYISLFNRLSLEAQIQIRRAR